MAASFLLLYVITNEKTLKLKQIDRLLAASKIFPSETRLVVVGTCCYIYLGPISQQKTEPNHVIKGMQCFTICDEKNPGYRIIELICYYLTNLGI